MTRTAPRREALWDAVSATVLYMSISLDGFVAGPNERSGKGSATAAMKPLIVFKKRATCEYYAMVVLTPL